MGQDGSTCTYQLSRGTQSAVLCLDKHGVISLDDFVPDNTTDSAPGSLSRGLAGAGTSAALPTVLPTAPSTSGLAFGRAA